MEAFKTVARTPEKWKDSFDELKGEANFCLSQKKLIDTQLAADESCSTVVTLIKREEDAEEGLETVMEKALSHGRYTEYGQWLLDSAEFEGWSKGFDMFRRNKKRGELCGSTVAMSPANPA